VYTINPTVQVFIKEKGKGTGSYCHFFKFHKSHTGYTEHFHGNVKVEKLKIDVRIFYSFIDEKNS